MRLDWMFQSALASTISAALLHFVWEGAAIGAALALGLAFSRKAAIRHALACASLIAMPVVFAITMIIVAPHGASNLHAAHPFTAVAAPMESAVAPPALLPALPSLLSWITPVWMAGVLGLLAYRLCGWLAAGRLRRRGTIPASEHWTQRLESMARQIGISRPVKLLESCIALAPATLGLLKPVIIVPIGLLAALPVDQVEAILLHELAHIRRADYLVNLLQTLIESLLFYHPAVWWISHVIRAERENCCDDVVLARSVDPKIYASALFAIAQESNRAAALAATGGNLVRRIRRILRVPAPRNSGFAVIPLAFAILIAGVAVAWPQSQPAPPPPAKPSVQAGQPGATAQEPRKIAQQIQRKQSPTPQPSAPMDPYKEWLAEDVRYIITPAERTQFQNLTSDQQREQFITDFWLRRDPTPGTAANEFREEHYRRIAYSNQHFGYPGHTGWFSDRGRTYIVYGPPDEIERHPGTGATARDKWMYRYIEGAGRNIVFEFVDDEGFGEFRLLNSPIADSSQRQRKEAQLKSTIAFLEGELKVLRQRYNENHPDVLHAMAEIEQAREALASLDRSN